MTNHQQARQERASESAVYLSGAGEVVDFLLPLFAGAAMGLTPSQIGVLMAVELAVSLVMRPMAGSLADRFERRSLAGVGALLYAISCAGYAIAPGATVAYIAAIIGGIGGALGWISLRAMVGERLDEDSGVFAKLVSAEEAGGWMIFAPALFLISLVGYRGVFAALAACCLIGAMILFTAPRNRPLASSGDEGPDSGTEAHRSRLLRRLSPMLVAVALIMIAEAAISLLLILHLQHEFALDPLEIGMVFLPGGIIMSLLPPYLHGVESRFGRTRVLALASVASAGFAVSLSFAPTPAIIAVCWVLTGAAWAVVLPVQQAVIAEASGRTHLGRGLGWYESASLLGALIGSLAAGYLYDLGTWQLACLVAAAVILSGAVIMPGAVRALRVTQYPSTPEPLEPEDKETDEEDPDDAEPEEAEEDDAEEPESTRGELVNSFGWHTAILAGSIVVAHLFIDAAHLTQVFSLPSVPSDPLGVEASGDWTREPRLWFQELVNWAGQLGTWMVDHLRGTGAIATALQIWIVIWAMDLINTLWKLPRAPRSVTAKP